MNGICRAVLAAGASGIVLLAAAQETQRPYRVAVILTTTPVAEMAGPDSGGAESRGREISLAADSKPVGASFGGALGTRAGGALGSFTAGSEAWLGASLVGPIRLVAG